MISQGEIWCWSLLGLKGLNGHPLDTDSSLQSNPVNTDTAGTIESVRNIGVSVLRGLDLNPDSFSHVTYLIRRWPMTLACARLSVIIIFQSHHSGTKKKWNTRNYREQNILFLNQCATAEVLHDSVSPQPHAVFFATFLHPLSSRSWMTLDVSYTISGPLHVSVRFFRVGRRYARDMSSITWVTVFIP